MAEKGVIVEFDFAAMDGAGLLFETTKAFLQKLDGIAFDPRIEDRSFAGNTYLSALTSYFAAVKTKKTAQKAARDIQSAFCAAFGVGCVQEFRRCAFGEGGQGCDCHTCAS